MIAARIKPRAIGGPGDALEIAAADAARIGGVKPLQRARVVNLDRRRVVEAHGELAALRVNRDAEGRLSTLRGRLRFEAAICAIAADLAVIGCGVKPVRAVERRAIAVLAAIVLVLGEKPPARRLPQPRAFAAAKRRCEARAIGREGEMEDDIAEAAEARDEPPRGGFEDVDAERSCVHCST